MENVSLAAECPHRLLRTGWRLVLAACLLLTLSSTALAQSSEQVERQIKAAYLLKFGNYVVWPPNAFTSPEQSFQIGIVGDDELADELAGMVAGRSVNGRNISVRKLRSGESASGINLLFVNQPSDERLSEQLARLKGSPTLVVTDSVQALAHGSMINFVMIDGRLRFEVAPKNAAYGKLNISARLLAVAYRVESS